MQYPRSTEAFFFPKGKAQAFVVGGKWSKNEKPLKATLLLNHERGRISQA